MSGLLSKKYGERLAYNRRGATTVNYSGKVVDLIIFSCDKFFNTEKDSSGMRSGKNLCLKNIAGYGTERSIFRYAMVRFGNVGGLMPF